MRQLIGGARLSPLANLTRQLGPVVLTSPYSQQAPPLASPFPHTMLHDFLLARHVTTYDSTHPSPQWLLLSYYNFLDLENGFFW